MEKEKLALVGMKKHTYSLLDTRAFFARLPTTLRNLTINSKCGFFKCIKDDGISDYATKISVVMA